jgi:cell division protein FtsB
LYRFRKPDKKDAAMNDALPPTGDARPTTGVRVRPRVDAAREARNGRRTAWVLAFVLVLLAVNAIIGDHGFLAARRAAQERDALAAAVAALRLENQHLQQEGRRLQTDPSAIADAAQRELGFVKPGETLVIIRDAAPARPSAAH